MKARYRLRRLPECGRGQCVTLDIDWLLDPAGEPGGDQPILPPRFSLN
jgi:hypothetical protein